MTYSRKDNQRISKAVAYTELNQRGTVTGVKKRRGTSTQVQTMRKGVIINNDITAPSWTGEIDIYKDGVATGETLDVDGSFLNGGEQFSEGKRVIVALFADENVWSIIAADCET